MLPESRRQVGTDIPVAPPDFKRQPKVLLYPHTPLQG